MISKQRIPKFVSAVLTIFLVASAFTGVVGAQDDNPGIQSGDVIKTDSEKLVRESPSPTWYVKAEVDAGAEAVALRDQVTVEGMTWTKVRFKNGVVGWITVDRTTKVASASSPEEDDLVIASTDAAVRAGPSPTWYVKSYVAENTEGTVVSGPFELEGYTWYKVEFQSGVEGWVTEDYIVKYPWTYTIADN